MAKYGFSAAFGKGEVHNTFADYALRIHRAIETVMQFIGEECVRIAREQGTYNDITGNLRNSIGYVLVRNGDIICKNFEERVASKVIDAANGKGILQGQALAEELAKRFTKGYALIVVAGMHYAHYVESLNKDVLDSAERYALQRVPKLMQMLKTQIYKNAV
ncbi:hypothetical protein [Muribaculum intestinale]|uniref:hypothetical protein n=2 Tax=Muribaculum intestinale TaxID=1796646 RepID=UPI00272C4A2C|nr:hypothetical protein [Muribaculum intestinale]